MRTSALPSILGLVPNQPAPQHIHFANMSEQIENLQQNGVLLCAFQKEPTFYSCKDEPVYQICHTKMAYSAYIHKLLYQPFMYQSIILYGTTNEKLLLRDLEIGY